MTPINKVDLTGFAERYAKDSSAVAELCTEQNVSAPTVYSAMRREGIKVRRTGGYKPGVRWKPTAKDDLYIRKHFPTKESLAHIALGVPSGAIHHTVLKSRARSLGVRRNTVRNAAHYSAPGPKIRTSDAAPIPVRFANVIQWLRAAGHNVRRDIKLGLWLINDDPGPVPPRIVVSWANNARTRHTPKALPLFDCDLSGLKGQDDAI